MSGRNPSLDGLRGIAILLVMASHCFFGVRGVNVLERFALGVAEAGWVGVDLFFVLSGYLITGILLDERSAPNYYIAFYGRRALRILPLYYAVLTAVTLASLALGSSRVFGGSPLWFWFHAANLQPAFTGWPSRALGHFWSLAIEEQFYLAWPLVVRWAGPRRLAGLCTAMLPASALLRFLLSGHMPAEVQYMNTLTRLDPLLLGSLLAASWRMPEARAWIPRLAPAAGAVAALGMLAVIVRDHGFYYGTWWGWRLALCYLFAGVLATALLIHTAAGSRLGMLDSPALVWIGARSYGLYILHMFIDEGARALGLHSASFLPAVAYFAFVLALSCLAAWASWELLEKRFLEWKGLFAYRPQTALPERRIDARLAA